MKNIIHKVFNFIRFDITSSFTVISLGAGSGLVLANLFRSFGWNALLSGILLHITGVILYKKKSNTELKLPAFLEAILAAKLKGTVVRPIAWRAQEVGITVLKDSVGDELLFSVTSESSSHAIPICVIQMPLMFIGDWETVGESELKKWELKRKEKEGEA